MLQIATGSCIKFYCQHPVLVISDFLVHGVVSDILQTLTKDLVNEIHKKESKITEYIKFSKNLIRLHLKGSNK